jgi:cystathionine beta-lyase family protein involved in aluminum resistance
MPAPRLHCSASTRRCSGFVVVAAEEGEEDIEIIMARIAAKEASKAVTIVETTDAPVRANASIVRVGDEMILFGGEYFDGAVNFCYDDVYRYNIVRGVRALVLACL